MLNYFYGEEIYEILGEEKGNEMVEILEKDSRLMAFEGAFFFDKELQDNLVNDYQEIKNVFDFTDDVLNYVSLEYQTGEEYCIGSLVIDERFLEDMIGAYVETEEFEKEFLNNPRAAIDNAKAKNLSYCVSELVAQVLREMNQKNIEVCDDIIKEALNESLVSQS